VSSGDRRSRKDAEDSWKHCLIMDEVDGMAGNEDRGGIQVRLVVKYHTCLVQVCVLLLSPYPCSKKVALICPFICLLPVHDITHYKCGAYRLDLSEWYTCYRLFLDWYCDLVMCNLFGYYINCTVTQLETGNRSVGGGNSAKVRLAVVSCGM